MGVCRSRSSHDDFANFTLEENRGKALFLRNCALCHLPDQDAHFVMTEPVNTGLDEDTRAPTAASATSRSSRRTSGASSRRRCATSRSPAPYMHDGRFATLEAVLDHYSSGGKNHPNKDVRVQPLHFTGSEKAALVAFLKTLTDRAVSHRSEVLGSVQVKECIMRRVPVFLVMLLAFTAMAMPRRVGADGTSTHRGRQRCSARPSTP